MEIMLNNPLSIFFLFIVYGLIIRYIIMVICLMVFKNLPNMSVVLGFGAIAWYWYYAENYAHLEAVNMASMIGLFLPEICKAITSKKVTK